MYTSTRNYKIFLYTLLLGFTACAAPPDQLLQALHAVDAKPLSAGHYVVIPNQGCEGCISTAEDFVKRNYTRFPQAKYIFTRVQSIKLLRIKLGNEVMNNSRVLIDSNNIIRYPEQGKDIYPMIITIKENAIKGITYQSPGSDGLAELLRAQ